MSTSTANKVTGTYFEELGGQQIELPREHRIVDVQRRGTTLDAEHNNLPEVDPPQSSNEEMLIIKPKIQQYTFEAFVTFVNANMHLVAADEHIQQHTF